jgi:hypothetical protein
MIADAQENSQQHLRYTKNNGQFLLEGIGKHDLVLG